MAIRKAVHIYHLTRLVVHIFMNKALPCYGVNVQLDIDGLGAPIKCEETCRRIWEDLYLIQVVLAYR